MNIPHGTVAWVHSSHTVTMTNNKAAPSYYTRQPINCCYCGIFNIEFGQFEQLRSQMCRLKRALVYGKIII